jgi:hypothetical protein
MSWCRAPCGTCDQILFPFGMLLSEICGLVSMGRPLWSVSQSVCLGVEPTLGLVTWYSFPSEGCSLKVTVSFLWGALSGQSVSMSWCRAHSRTCDLILLPIGGLQSESYYLVSVGRPLWREDVSTICRAITQRPESRRTHNHTLLSHLRLPQPRRPDSRIYIPQVQGGSVITPATGFPLRRILRLVGLRWRYSNPPTYVISNLYVNIGYIPRLELFWESGGMGELYRMGSTEHTSYLWAETVQSANRRVR